MDHVKCKQEYHDAPTQDLQGNIPRNVKVEKEDVICVKIKEEEIPAEISPDPRGKKRIYEDFDDEGPLYTWEEEESLSTVTGKWRLTRSRMSKNIRDSDSESAHHKPELYESSSEEAELSQAGPSQLPSISHPVILPRHNMGRETKRGSKRSRKRWDEAEFMESVLHRLNKMNEERSSHLKEMMSQREIIMRQLRDEDDSDMLFLKSLLPMMKEMPTPRKMECWTAMMDVMARFLASSSTTHPPTQAQGAFSHSPCVLTREPYGHLDTPLPPVTPIPLGEHQYYPA